LPLKAAAALSRKCSPGQELSEQQLEAINAMSRSKSLSGSTQAFERRCDAAIEVIGTMFAEMDFGFLYNPSRQLLSIGYRIADSSLDPNCYDLLASEARLASFIAIARGDLLVKHWFRQGREVTLVDRGAVLISWSGSMSNTSCHFWSCVSRPAAYWSILPEWLCADR
jgi:hypothetical protein